MESWEGGQEDDLKEQNTQVNRVSITNEKPKLWAPVSLQPAVPQLLLGNRVSS